MSTYHIIGFCVGFLAVAIICFIFVKKKCSGQYDERQKAIQGVAYKFGFFTMIFYFLFNGFICMEIGNWLPLLHMNFIGVCFGIACYAGYAIFNDAYISLNTKPFKILLPLAFVSVINYIGFLISLGKEDDSYFETYLLSLICAILLTAVIVMLIIKIIIDKCREKKELVDE